MVNAQDFTKSIQDMMSKIPTDTKAFHDAFKTQAALAEKMAKAALDAAEKSTEISSAWAKSAIAKTSDLAASKPEPTDYAKSAGDFASAAAEMAAENLAAFAEVAKKLQMETVELMLAAGKEVSDEASNAVKKATAEVTEKVKKATAPAK